MLSSQLARMGRQADINCTCEHEGQNLSPLILAVKSAHQATDLKTIKYLLEKYADVNFTEERTGLTALMITCLEQNDGMGLEIIKVLTEHRHLEGSSCLVNFNMTDRDGHTALHFAAMSNKREICKYLVQVAIMDVHAQNVDGQTPKDLAKDKEVVKVLLP